MSTKLQAFQIAVAGTQLGTAATGYAKCGGLSVLAEFSTTGVTGGTPTLTVYVQTSYDGVKWFDIACLSFAQATATKSCNVDGLAAVTTASPVSLSLPADTVRHGQLADQFRAAVVVGGTGSYNAGSSVTVHIQDR